MGRRLRWCGSAKRKPPPHREAVFGLIGAEPNAVGAAVAIVKDTLALIEELCGAAVVRMKALAVPLRRPWAQTIAELAEAAPADLKRVDATCRGRLAGALRMLGIGDSGSAKFVRRALAGLGVEEG